MTTLSAFGRPWRRVFVVLIARGVFLADARFGFPADPPAVQFSNVTAAAGVGFRHHSPLSPERHIHQIEKIHGLRRLRDHRPG